MLLLLTDTVWARALHTGGIVLACWAAVAVPAALVVGAFIRAGKGGGA